MSERHTRLDALFRSYGADIVAYCGWRAPTHADAQDAVSDVFLTAWRRLDDIPDGDAGRVWLYATARRVLANQRRTLRRRAALASRLAGEAAVSRELEPTREDALVQEALGRLSVRDREVLLLAEWEGLAAAELAAVLRCPPVTARGRLHRARRRFHAAFEELRAGERRTPRLPMTIGEGGS